MPVADHVNGSACKTSHEWEWGITERRKDTWGSSEVTRHYLSLSVGNAKSESCSNYSTNMHKSENDLDRDRKHQTPGLH